MTIAARRLAFASCRSGELPPAISDCVGKTVRCPEGVTIGKVIDVILTEEGDAIRFCIVSFGSVTHFGDDCRVVPFEICCFEPGAECVSCTLAADALRDAPIYLPGHEAMDEAWWRRVEDYYGARSAA